AEPYRTCFTAGGSKTSPVEQQPELQQPQDTVSLPLPPLPHATPDPFTLYRGSGCKSPRCSIQAADLSLVFGQQSPPPRLLRGSPTPISSLEQNERADVEASQVVRLQTMSKREGGELSLHERSWNAHGLGRVGFDRNALVVRKDQKEPN
ncbi:hypothetical protein MJT46_017293, partial [Ovis ammon polii x Ovis aries]